MPSLSDALDNLRAQSEQLSALCTHNAAPAGPFVRAYLHLDAQTHGSGSGSGSVLDLIRDASQGERRLFKFVGEEAAAPGAAGGNKRVEKRETRIVTPLKEMRRRQPAAQGQGRDETEVILRTAMKLVDDYRPMPRARAHITNLLDAHHASLERVAQLERLIDQANKPAPARNASPTRPPTSSSSLAAESSPSGSNTPRPKLTPEQAIKAEEAALRALEASLIPLRRAAKPAHEDEFSSPPASSSKLPSSPPTTGRRPVSTANANSETPARQFVRPDSGRTPAREMPHVTNSLVTATPRRVDRFSPLKFLGTPRAPLGPSGLRGDTARPGQGRPSIFGRHRALSGRSSVLHASTSGGATGDAQTPATALRSSVFGGPSLEAGSGASTTPAPAASTLSLSASQRSDRAERLEAQEAMNETIRIPAPPVPVPVPGSPAVLAPAVPAESPSTPQIEEREDARDDTPKAGPARPAGPEFDDGVRKVGGVEVDSESVKGAIAKIWSTVGEMMRQGLKDGQVVEPDVESTVKHLQHLSISDLPPPLSPSSSSTLLSPSNAVQAKPLTPETILFSHMFISLLRASSASGSGGAAGEVDMNELKETLSAVAKARNFEGGSGLGTKIIYAAVGKRVVKIERGGRGSRVKFAS